MSDKTPQPNYWAGPAITWNRNDVLAMVKEIGEQGAVDRITGNTFNRQFVLEMVRDIVSGAMPDELIETAITGGIIGEDVT